MNTLIQNIQPYLTEGNSLTKVGYVLMSVFAIFAVEKIVKLIISRHLKSIAANNEIDFNKKIRNSICIPTGFIVWISGINITINSMISKDIPILKGIISVSLVFFISWLLFSLIEVFGNYIGKKYDTNGKDMLVLQFFPLINKVLKAIIVFVAIIVAMQSNGYSAASLLTGFGVVGMAVGIAAKETIANFFGSFAVVMDSVYKQGDFIAIDKTMNGANVEGVVEEINLRSTKIRAADDTLLIIPNNIMANITIKNISLQNKKLLNETFEISLEAEPQKIENALDACKRVLAAQIVIDSDYKVNLNKINTTTCQINLVAFAKTTNAKEFLSLKNEILLLIIKEFKQIGVFDYICASTLNN